MLTLVADVIAISVTLWLVHFFTRSHQPIDWSSGFWRWPLVYAVIGIGIDLLWQYGNHYLFDEWLTENNWQFLYIFRKLCREIIYLALLVLTWIRIRDESRHTIFISLIIFNTAFILLPYIASEAWRVTELLQDGIAEKPIQILKRIGGSPFYDATEIFLISLSLTYLTSHVRKHAEKTSVTKVLILTTAWFLSRRFVTSATTIGVATDLDHLLKIASPVVYIFYICLTLVIANSVVRNIHQIIQVPRKKWIGIAWLALGSLFGLQIFTTIGFEFYLFSYIHLPASHLMSYYASSISAYLKLGMMSLVALRIGIGVFGRRRQQQAPI